MSDVDLEYMFHWQHMEKGEYYKKIRGKAIKKAISISNSKLIIIISALVMNMHWIILINALIFRSEQ